MKQIKLKQTQRGRNLLMSMAVLAIIGIFAEVALSAYQDYVAMSKPLNNEFANAIPSSLRHHASP